MNFHSQHWELDGPESEPEYRITLIFWVCVCICGRVHAKGADGGQRGNFWELVLSLKPTSSWDQIQALRLGSKCLYTLRRLSGPVLREDGG